MKRLVYRPKVWAYVKASGGSVPVDITPFIVGGEVNRVVNDVSTASLTIRNPDFRFTTPGNPTFKPMDPITIFMARNVSRPVRVFTGFLDETGYLQLFPGTIVLKASCTIKRLKYTYWDPALPFTKYFMQKYGWIQTENGTTENLGAIVGQQVIRRNYEDAADTVIVEGNLNDSGLSNLLSATMQAVGNWSQEDLLIEPLPATLMEDIDKLWFDLKNERGAIRDALKEFLQKSIGDPPEEVAGGGSGSADAAYGPVDADVGGAVQKAIRRANAIHNKNQPYLWGGGHSSFNDPKGYDCSGFVSSVLHYAGLLNGSPLTTVELAKWGKKGEGRQMTVWVKETGNARASHCFITFRVNENGITKNRFAEAGGSGKGRTGWHAPRSTAGFEPRHWPGT